MHIHILGICGTFMGGLALLARERGFDVSGSDANVYPPMSDQLAAAGIDVMQGYLPEHLQPAPDMVVMGNAMSRGNPAVEYVLNRNLPYISGPQWLAENILLNRWVLAVSGTHGKTTTSSMLAWILEYAGMQPGFLIGGVPGNFGQSAAIGNTPFFVIEADEYDTAFFDKRSKFIHYHPRTLVINNLEFDHADIFADLAAIQTQFHHLIRTVPAEGLVITPHAIPAIEQTLERGCWTPRQTLNDVQADWQLAETAEDGHSFTVQHNQNTGKVDWSLLGQHNVNNALAAIAAAHHVGVTVEHACEALNQFKGVKRRLELRGECRGIKVYDDFAHHPTAIATTLQGLRANIGQQRLIAVLEPRSNTMKMGVHEHTLAASLNAADMVILYQDPQLTWSLDNIQQQLGDGSVLLRNIDDVVEQLVNQSKSGDHIVVMSNGGFGGIHQKILDALNND
ncbi:MULTISPECIES: UDP-N-acetylmuramate:L-alanyl-gamma-D-glutamyl-meso-diaminopimelate ligase [unclassified Methylophaga]|jgi:UDP-N-acetylmuramate: L-alanyl-gamma-D-glutamyl-meso-diaminopimelate ligase|uniref:UDP-N-acetylmuramate:L-alanyl-gamma-D-glutamyl- meso-diaminopimelate ligase n=3 Tax=Methylophaga TaxID=40222 RepID=UPI000C97545C|nr:MULTISPECIES: UDP-N-acetylmuramate:L-alanyl-gamma-D-glutamyl-meso-diaminopimelate ligase [unclassified Methylophaga]MAL50637.1 UDP-N-acetylmuramate:L-alanyl-gamma-D-glutamyl-meso-diaminopimelate ligase [Methylophaga sp.]MDX1749603.1 UDP-N-acetylmuramate:L-alanyl-gamma-D-glutamyl-meso-diaminopimelate ligase [Methylophaga sp.]|tara:strand:- start:8189 stop:9544 length:1356 start_codon:yes stop_codon:yes gene_type:complete